MNRFKAATYSKNTHQFNQQSTANKTSNISFNSFFFISFTHRLKFQLFYYIFIKHNYSMCVFEFCLASAREHRHLTVCWFFRCCVHISINNFHRVRDGIFSAVRAIKSIQLTVHMHRIREFCIRRAVCLSFFLLKLICFVF